MNSSHHHFVPAYEDAPSPSSNPDETEDVYQSIVKNRKSWKTARSGEVVWPPELEQALLEGTLSPLHSPFPAHPLTHNQA